MDTLGLIHTNGRVYDPNLGRFVSADPFVAGIDTTQGVDRYGHAERPVIRCAAADRSGARRSLEAGSVVDAFSRSVRVQNGSVDSREDRRKEELMTVEALENGLIASLPATELQRWVPHLEAVEFQLGQVLYESGRTLAYAYFPTTAIVSLLSVMENGASAEIAVVGREGVVGISLFMGGESTTSRAVVQSAGAGFRMRAKVIKEEFNRSAPVMHLLLRYTQALITQMAQTAVCNRHHSLDQQLCRLLLLSLDRLQGSELLMTQDLIANMLGVRREGVTAAALKLQKAGIIQYARGHITVLDRAGLEVLTCECYAVVQKEYIRLLPARTAI